jgi:hypothetical protein
MLAFRDFIPRQLEPPRFGFSSDAVQGTYASLDETLAVANEWLAGAGVSVVTVETIVLPSLWADWEQGSKDPVVGAPSGAPLWYQFIRVWYELDAGS